MTAAGWIALAITIFGAFSYAAASILQAVGARRSTSTVQTLGHPLYLIGTACDLLAWAGSMVALRELAVYLVESVLAGSLAITVVAARIFLASRLRKRDAVAIVVTVAALTVLAMSAGPQEAVVASPALRLGFCVAAVLLALIGWGATKAGSPGVVAGLAGLGLGAAALCGRALALPPHAAEHPLSAVLAIVTEPMTGALLVFAVTGMLLYANALQRGQVGPVTAVLWIAEVIAPSAMALLMLGDTVRSGWNLPATVAGLVTIAAAVLLASAPANNDTATPSADGTPAPPPVLPPAPIPVSPRVARGGERIIWWGPPPVWVPPVRPQPAVRARPAAAELTWAPAHAEPRWQTPRPADADSVEATPPPRRHPAEPAHWSTAEDPTWWTAEDPAESGPLPRWHGSGPDDESFEAAPPTWHRPDPIEGPSPTWHLRGDPVEAGSPSWRVPGDPVDAGAPRWPSSNPIGDRVEVASAHRHASGPAGTDPGEASSPPPEWPPRHPTPMAAPVDRRPTPLSPWHDL